MQQSGVIGKTKREIHLTLHDFFDLTKPVASKKADSRIHPAESQVISDIY